MLVEECMTSDPVVVSRAEPLTTAADLLHRKRIHQVPVIDGHDHLVGIVTHHDLTAIRPSEQRSRSELRVEDVMTSDVVCATRSMDVREAVDLLRQRHCRSLPVMDGHHLVGILSTTDLLSTLRKRLDQVPATPAQPAYGPW